MSVTDNRVYIFDTSLRDGEQDPDVNLSLWGKYAVASLLSELGIDYVEGGLPAGGLPNDEAFFDNPPDLGNGKLVAFGMLYRAGETADSDAALLKTLRSKASSACLVAKSSRSQIEKTLPISPKENLEAIATCVRKGRELGKEMMIDFEHFFDGYKEDPDYAIACLRAAFEAGASWLVLCDTNGGSFPHEVTEIVEAAVKALPDARFGIHAHDDCGCAVANTIAAVRAGCRQVQGTLNGIGERCSNANLVTVIGNLDKLGYETGVTPDRLVHLTEISEAMDAILDREPNPNAPYVGRNAFAQKAGIHASAVGKDASAYSHYPPERVGNQLRIVVSGMSGKSNVLAYLRGLNIDLRDDDPRLPDILNLIKQRDAQGYCFQKADATLRLLLMEQLGLYTPYFSLNAYRATTNAPKAGIDKPSNASAFVSVRDAAGKVFKANAKSPSGQLDALDKALRMNMGQRGFDLSMVELKHYKVRELPGQSSTAARISVMIEMYDKQSGQKWRTIGVSGSVIDASMQALEDGYNYAMLLNEPKPAAILTLSQKARTNPAVTAIFERLVA